MEDFRTIAKQFVPDSMADEILEMAKRAIERDKASSNAQPAFRNNPIPDAAQEAYEATVRSKHKRLQSKLRNATTSKYELTLDDLVEKVKERLQSELALMAATAAKKRTVQHAVEILSTKMPSEMTLPDDSVEIHETSRHAQARFVKKTSAVIENDEKEHVKKDKPKKEKAKPDERYVAEMFVAQPPKYLFDLGKPVTVKPKDVSRLGIPELAPNHHQVTNKKTVKQVRKIVRTKKRNAITTKAQSLFKGVDMVQANDSYEDYVIPKKDEGYDEPETQPPKYKTVQKNPYIQKQPLTQKNKKILDVFSDEDEATTKAKDNVNYEDETINYNKKKRVIKKGSVETKQIHDDGKYFKQRHRELENSPAAEPLVADNTDHQIQPYAEQLHEPEDDETEQPVTEELKARSEAISFNDDTNSQYVAPHVVKHNVGKQNKKVIKPKMATVIPKRDGYKMSSPNYLVKLPIVGEKYHFDEPIPEDDRVPEKLEPMKNLKSIINGKVVLL